MSHLWTRLILPEKVNFSFYLWSVLGNLVALFCLQNILSFLVKSIKCWFFVKRQKFNFLNFSDFAPTFSFGKWKINSSIHFVYSSDVIDHLSFLRIYFLVKLSRTWRDFCEKIEFPFEQQRKNSGNHQVSTTTGKNSQNFELEEF